MLEFLMPSVKSFMGESNPVVEDKQVKDRVRVVVTHELSTKHYYINQYGCPLYHALQNAGVDVVMVSQDYYYYRTANGILRQHPCSYSGKVHLEVSAEGSKDFVHYHRDIPPSIWQRIKGR